MEGSITRKEEILKKLNENAHELNALGVKRLALFGSFARGEENSDSDIDLLVEFETNKKTFDNFMALSFFLEDLLKHKVELVTRESLSPYIGPYILKEAEYVSLAA